MRHLPFLALLLATPAAAKLSPAETKMQAAVTADAPAMEALLEQLVRQNSGTLNLAGVRKVGDMVRAELEPLGFKVTWIDMAETGRAGHLVATHRGNGRGKRTLLIAHLDTVFEPTSPFRGWQREGSRAIGPGSGDDKGGVVVVIAAMRAMLAAGTLKNADIEIVMTGDEERSGKPLDVARRDLIAAGRRANVALEYENLATENGAEFGSTARRSSTDWTLTTTGRSGHSSGVFGRDLGYGAIYELARIIDTFRRELPEANLTYNVGVMAGGTPGQFDKDQLVATATGKPNITAAGAVARGDLRALIPEQNARVIARMKAIVAQHLPATEASITFSDGYPAMAPTDGNRAVLAKLNAANRDLGLPEMAEFDPAKRGAADSSFVAADVDTLAGMGPISGNAHADGEWVDLASIPRQALRSAVLISRYAAERR